MADREKLIEVLKGYRADPPCDTCEHPIGYCDRCGLDRLADFLIANGVTIQPLTDCKQPVGDKLSATAESKNRKIAIRFKNFEIRPTAFLDGHIDPTKFDVVKWYDHEPWEAINLRTGKKETSTRSCYSIAHIYWDEKEPCWEFSSVGTRFLEDYEEGLCEFIREWIELIGEPEGE